MDDTELAAAITIQGLKSIGQSAIDAVRKNADKKRTLAEVRALSEELDELVERTLPTFGSWDRGTLGHVACNHGLGDGYQATADSVATTLAWFNHFAARRGSHHDAAEPYVRRFLELDDVLFWTSRYGLQLQAMVMDPRSTALPSLRISAGHYDNFLDNYEDLRERLARAVGASSERLTFFRLSP